MKDLGIFGDEDVFAELPSKTIYTKVDREKVKKAYLDWNESKITEKEFGNILEESVISYGMTKDQIVNLCPPTRHTTTYNRSKLIRLVLLQVWRDEGDSRPPTSVRDLWYSYLIYVVTRVMGDTKIRGITATIGQQLTKLRKDYGFLYQNLNVESERYEFYQVAPENSPYQHVILAVEKARYFHDFKGLAKKYGVNLACLGGQDSYGASEMLLFELFDRGISHDDTLTILALGDFDPDGDDIGGSVREHFGDLGMEIEFEKIFVRRDQIHEQHVRRYAVPYTIDKSEQGNKQKLTKYTKWAKNSGGLYIDENENLKKFPKQNGGYDIPDFSNKVDDPLKDFRKANLTLGKLEMEFQDVDVIIELSERRISDLVDYIEYYLQEFLEIAKTQAEKNQDKNYKKLKTELGIGLKEKQKLKDVRNQFKDRKKDITSDVDNLREEKKNLENEIETKAFEYAESALQITDEQIEQTEDEIEDLREKLERRRDDLSDLRNTRNARYRELETDYLESHQYVDVFGDVLNDIAQTYLSPFQEIYKKIQNIENVLDGQDETTLMYVKDTVDPHDFIPPRETLKKFLTGLDLSEDIFTKDGWKVEFDDSQNEALIENVKEKMLDKVDILKEKIVNVPLSEELKNEKMSKRLSKLKKDIKETKPKTLSDNQEAYLKGIKYYINDPSNLIDLTEKEIKNELIKHE